MKAFFVFVGLTIVFGLGCVVYNYVYGGLIPQAHAELCAPIDVCFNPNGKCDAKIFNALDQLMHNKKNTTVRVSAYILSNSKFSERFQGLSEVGHEVRVLYDRQCEESFLASSCKIGTMPSVQTKRVEMSNAINHNKYIIVGNYLVITGSANMTKQAYERNLENVVFIWDRETIKKYIADFDRTWLKY
jgi:hypothetical protein